MITDEKASYWQVKTLEGINYQSESLEVLLQWVFESRVGAGDLVFSPETHDWVAISREPLLKGCFWQIRTSTEEVYGPVSIGEFKQLFMNNQINAETQIAPYATTGQWLTIKDLPDLERWLVEEYGRSMDYNQFLDKLNKQLFSQEEIPGEISRKEKKLGKKIAELEQKIKLKEEQINEFKLSTAQLEKELEAERLTASEMKVRYSEAEPEREAVFSGLQKLNSELQEKMLFIEELNKQMAQMEVANTIKDDEIRELREHLESVKGDIPAQLDLLQQKLQDERESVRQLQLDKELLEQNVEEQKQPLLQKQKELEGDISRLANEKEGLQNFIYTLQDDLTKVTSEKEQLQQTISGPKEGLKTELEERDRLSEFNKDLENRIQGLGEEVAILEEKLKTKGIKDAQIQALLNNKEQLLQELVVKEESLSQLKQKVGSADDIYKLEQERFSQQLKDMAEELGHREELIKRLESQLSGLKGEYQTRLEELEGSLARQAEQFKSELAQKTDIWETTFNEEKNKWEEIQRNLEGELVQTKAELESQVLEKEKLQVDIAYKNKEWEDRLARLQEDGRKQYEELVQERENLESELTSKIHSLEAEREKLHSDLDQADKTSEELLQDKNILQQELGQRERFIEEIKREAVRQERILKEREEALAKAENRVGELEDKIAGLTGQLQNELDIQNSLRGEIAAINEELAQAKHMIEQLNAEKERLKGDLQRQKEDFSQKEKSLEQELEEVKRDWEHALEENRSIQRQFYLEKQKLTREYTETINKQAKLEKRNQLEREITDRTRMKEELERLYALLKGNLEGLQQGASEIQSSLQQIQGDIDNKRLSLKYISESERRVEKKGQFPKPESTVNNTPTEE